jgi:hypothetical protein
VRLPEPPKALKLRYVSWKCTNSREREGEKAREGEREGEREEGGRE